MVTSRALRVTLSAVTALLALTFAPAAGAAVGDAAGLPNDPLVDRGGQDLLSVVHAPEAWQQAGDSTVTVAIVDSGVQLDHPDLAGVAWTNPGEVDGNGVDDDHDGYVDDVHGWDFIHGDPVPEDDEGHGTHVAGIVAARPGNGIGVAGLAPQAKIMALKVLDGDRRGTTTDVAAAIQYAVKHGAQIVNLSLNGSSSAPDLDAAIDAARDKGVLVVASAGNDGRDIDAQPSYPASSSDANVVTVASVDSTSHLSSFSNHGSAVDIAAPGEDVVSTAPDSDYETRSGTSMSAAEVSGVLALLAAARPEAPASAWRDALFAGAAHPAGAPDVGVLDAAGALRQMIPAAEWRDVTPPSPFGLLRTPARRASKAVKVTLRWKAATDDKGVAGYRVLVDGKPAATVSAARAGTPRPWARVKVRPGRHTWQVVAVDAAGNQRESAPASISVRKPARVRHRRR